MGWKAIARYAVGTSHKEQKIPCQDCGHYRIFDDVIVGAVADVGMGIDIYRCLMTLT